MREGAMSIPGPPASERRLVEAGRSGEALRTRKRLA
jgi:hypothetical protein